MPRNSDPTSREDHEVWDGQSMYRVFRLFLSTQEDVEIDTWNELEQSDKNAWNHMAEYTQP